MPTMLDIDGWRVLVERATFALGAAPAFHFKTIYQAGAGATPVLLGSGGGEAADVRVGNPKRVVFVVFDELPTESLLDGSGRVDAELFPNFARLAATSTWYRNESTVAPYTQTAVPAIVRVFAVALARIDCAEESPAFCVDAHVATAALSSLAASAR